MNKSYKIMNPSLFYGKTNAITRPAGGDQGDSDDSCLSESDDSDSDYAQCEDDSDDDSTHSDTDQGSELPRRSNIFKGECFIQHKLLPPAWEEDLQLKQEIGLGGRR
ncbi:uncharacterized protein [Anabrus simplex]|uniref:uncharacterized protein isoform X2 n=1 Tax=Anabrus simplex TaxID=316456 RepID=UPI0035A33849